MENKLSPFVIFIESRSLRLFRNRVVKQGRTEVPCTTPKNRCEEDCAQRPKTGLKGGVQGADLRNLPVP